MAVLCSEEETTTSSKMWNLEKLITEKNNVLRIMLSGRFTSELVCVDIYGAVVNMGYLSQAEIPVFSCDIHHGLKCK